jgi:hypothetical protein
MSWPALWSGPRHGRGGLVPGSGPARCARLSGRLPGPRLSLRIRRAAPPDLASVASVAEQNRVFANALAQGGQSNWFPYDGC